MSIPHGMTEAEVNDSCRHAAGLIEAMGRRERETADAIVHQGDPHGIALLLAAAVADEVPAEYRQRVLMWLRAEE